ncbi:MAG: arsenate reductase ArsC [Bacteroides sp.]|nr:arsenate reductase ArsC [Roseburia sp.]MCM1347247.1 arsenate reductase ArsC [Bacteroides sp.]MCM1421748.1 arsenate reductase ArsC [Bacteroides sp.]
MRILILCTGNSCRSQMAHGYLQSLDCDLQVCSAGTVPATEVNPMAVEVMKEKGIDISTHTPHNVSEYSDEKWDYVITVCGDADANCPVFSGKVGKRLHFGFEDPAKAEGNNDEKMDMFRRVRDKIFTRFRIFYSEIKTEKQ